MLTASLGSQYPDMLYYLEGAEEYDTWMSEDDLRETIENKEAEIIELDKIVDGTPYQNSIEI